MYKWDQMLSCHLWPFPGLPESPSKIPIQAQKFNAMDGSHWNLKFRLDIKQDLPSFLFPIYISITPLSETCCLFPAVIPKFMSSLSSRSN